MESICLIVDEGAARVNYHEATGANLQVNKRVLKWKPFWNEVYTSYDQSDVMYFGKELLKTMCFFEFGCFDL